MNLVLAAQASGATRTLQRASVPAGGDQAAVGWIVTGGGGYVCDGSGIAADRGLVHRLQVERVGSSFQAGGRQLRQAQGFGVAAAENVGGSVQVVDAFDELVQEGRAGGT